MKTTLLALWGWLRHDRARVLLYHSISDTPADPLAVPPPAFVQQLAWLAAHNYHVITAAALVDGLRQGRAHWRRTVVLSFDDAYQDFFDTAMPILREHNYSATLFVPTGCLGQASRWNVNTPARPVMTAAQVAQAALAGHELGSHTMTHPALPALDPVALRAELDGSRVALARITGAPPATLAYPFGLAGAREQAAAERAGFAGAFLAGGLWGNGRASQHFSLARDMLGRALPLAQFARLVTGAADLDRLLRDVLRPPLATRAAPE